MHFQFRLPQIDNLARIVPDTDIDLEKLQSGNLMTKRKNISFFLKVTMMMKNENDDDDEDD